MDKLNLMKAVLTLYLSAVVAIFLFRPTVKVYLPAKVEGRVVCIQSNPVGEENVMAQFLLLGNNRYKLRYTEDNCFELASPVPFAANAPSKVLLVKQGRSMWTALTKK